MCWDADYLHITHRRWFVDIVEHTTVSHSDFPFLCLGNILDLRGKIIEITKSQMPSPPVFILLPMLKFIR
jgi:hypothetical protein